MVDLQRMEEMIKTRQTGERKERGESNDRHSEYLPVPAVKQPLI